MNGEPAMVRLARVAYCLLRRINRSSVSSLIGKLDPVDLIDPLIS